MINTSTKEIVRVRAQKNMVQALKNPDGHHFAFQSENLTSIVLFDTKTWERTTNIPIDKITFSFDGLFNQA